MGRVFFTLAVLAILVIAGFQTSGHAVATEVTQIRFLGKHGKKANLRINNRVYSLGPGEASKEGVKLLAVQRNQAIIRYAGQTISYARGSKHGQRLPEQISIPRAAHGMFVTEGTINGVTVNFVVDTGASHVVISMPTARRLGISAVNRQPIKIVTASRTESAYAVNLDSVSVGGIFLSNVRGIITRGKYPEVTLLGMSFLGHLSIQQDAQRMTLGR